MKNEKIAAAWDSVLPDRAADDKMRRNILAYAQKERRIPMKHAKKYLALAACMVCVIAAAVFGVRSGWFDRRYTVTLESGEAIVYQSVRKPDRADSMVYDGELNHRALTAEELKTLFPALADAAASGSVYADFDAKTGALVYAEGRLGDVHIHLAAAGVPLTDTVIPGTESTAKIGGTDVKTGYTVTKRNSKGNRTAIFYAEYALNGTAVDLELAGDSSEGVQLSERLTGILCGMIGQNAPDAANLQYLS